MYVQGRLLLPLLVLLSQFSFCFPLLPVLDHPLGGNYTWLELYMKLNWDYELCFHLVKVQVLNSNESVDCVPC